MVAWHFLHSERRAKFMLPHLEQSCECTGCVRACVCVCV